MKKYSFVLIFILSFNTLFAQNSSIDRILSDIEFNNLALKTLREEDNALKLYNKEGIALSNPEFEFNYIWGAHNNYARGKGIAISQEFDFQTILGYKSKVAKNKNELIDISLKENRLNILLDAKLLCYDLIYLNALFDELTERLNLSKRNVDVFKKRFENGDVSVLEFNKAKLEYALAKGELSEIEVQRQDVISQLTILNGGKEVILTDNSFEAISPLPLFDVWYREAELLNPVLEYARKEVELKERELKLNRAAWIPKLSAEYSREWEDNLKVNGITFGISIPLWADIKKVKSAKAFNIAAESKNNELKTYFFYNIKNDYEKSVILQKSAAETKIAVEELSNLIYLEKALDCGEISMLDYIIEVQLYYDAKVMSLNAQRAYFTALAKLTSYSL